MERMKINAENDREWLLYIQKLLEGQVFHFYASCIKTSKKLFLVLHFSLLLNFLLTLTHYLLLLGKEVFQQVDRKVNPLFVLLT